MTDTVPATAGIAASVGCTWLGNRVLFHRGDAEQLPFPAASFDAVVCECAFCIFPGKPAAASEIARVLRPGGRVGITDVTIALGGLPGDLAGLAGWVACLADARPADAYAALLGSAGLTVTTVEEHDDALGRLVDQIDARLRVLRMSGRNQAPAGVDLDRALELTGQMAAQLEAEIMVVGAEQQGDGHLEGAEFSACGRP